MSDKPACDEDYRRRACDLVQAASMTEKPQHRLLLLQMASAWIKLDEHFGAGAGAIFDLGRSRPPRRDP